MGDIYIYIYIYIYIFFKLYHATEETLSSFCIVLSERSCSSSLMCCVVREKLFKQSLTQLKEEMMKANVLVREANFLAQEMAKDAEFSVTLQIPAANLSPNRKVSALWDTATWWHWNSPFRKY